MGRSWLVMWREKQPRLSCEDFGMLSSEPWFKNLCSRPAVTRISGVRSELLACSRIAFYAWACLILHNRGVDDVKKASFLPA